MVADSVFYFIFVVWLVTSNDKLISMRKRLLYATGVAILSLCAGMSGASGADRRVVALDKSSSGTVAETPPPLVLDSALTPEVPFTPLAVTMYGYAKRVSDARETFVLRNETRCYHISRVMVKIVYSTQDGKPFHTREELVECDLMPGSSRVVTLKSFDTAKTYYYYLNPPVRAAGIPYMVRYDILRYDVVVE